MATPYLQFRRDEVSSTQDEARAALDRLPVVVISQRQTGGRGRTGSEWVNAPRPLAVSVACSDSGEDMRPISLLAGVAVTRVLDGVDLKWPNDVLKDDLKVGGILVERSGDDIVAGLGVNLWWPDPPRGVGAVYEDDPGPEVHARLGALWAAEFLAELDREGWEIDEYRAACATLGRDIEWDPDGRGRAVGISDDGSLIVDTVHGIRTLTAGAVRHVR